MAKKPPTKRVPKGTNENKGKQSVSREKSGKGAQNQPNRSSKESNRTGKKLSAGKRPEKKQNPEDEDGKVRILDILFNSDVDEIERKLSTTINAASAHDSAAPSGASVPKKSLRQKGQPPVDVEHELKGELLEFKRRNGELYDLLKVFLKNLCTSVDKIYSNYLTPNEVFVLLSKDISLLSSYFFNRLSIGSPKDRRKPGEGININANKEVKLVENDLMNILYEKLVLVVIYTCKNHSDPGVIEKISGLIYRLTTQIFSQFIAYHLQDSEYNQNKLLLHIWDMLLLLIFCKDRKLRVNFALFLETLVRNACVDEMVINSKLYKKHIQTFLNLLNDNFLQMQLTSLKLLQSFQIKEVLDTFLTSLTHENADVRTTTIELLEVDNPAILEHVIARLRDQSPLVRGTVYKKLGTLFASIPVHSILYILNSGATEPEREVVLEFYSMITSWVREQGLEGFINTLSKSTLQMSLVAEVLVSYFRFLTSAVSESGAREMSEPEEIAYNTLVNNRDNYTLTYVNAQVNPNSPADPEVLARQVKVVLSEFLNKQPMIEALKNRTAKDAAMDVADRAELYQLINKTNMVLRILNTTMGAADPSLSEAELQAKMLLETDLKKLLLLLPIKFVTVTLVDEYMQLTTLDPNHSLVADYLIANNPVYYLLICLSFSGAGRGVLDSSEVMLEVLKDIYDPFELNEIKKVRISMTDLKTVGRDQVEALNFQTYSLHHLTQFSAQLQNELKNHREHQSQLQYMYDNAQNRTARERKNSKRRRLEEEIRETGDLVSKQERILNKVSAEINNRHLHILVIIYIYFNLSNAKATDQRTINDIFNVYIMPILTSFSNSTETALGPAGEVSEDVEYYNNLIVLMCMCIYNIITFQADGSESAHEKTARVHKELGIYHVLFTNLVDLLSADGGDGSNPKSEHLNENNIYTYKLEVMLKIIVDLIYLLHSNNALSTASREKGRDSHDLVPSILDQVLAILRGKVRINRYIYSVVVKVMPKVVQVANSLELLQRYVLCILEILIFTPLDRGAKEGLDLNDYDRLILFNIVSSLYKNNYELARDSIDLLIRGTFNHILSSGASNAAKEDVLCRFKYFFIYMSNLNPAAKADIFEHVRGMLLIMAAANFTNPAEILNLIQYLLNKDEQDGTALYLGLKYFYVKNARNLRNNKMFRLVLSKLGGEGATDEVLSNEESAAVEEFLRTCDTVQEAVPLCKFLSVPSATKKAARAQGRGKRRSTSLTSSDDGYASETTESELDSIYYSDTTSSNLSSQP